nr:MAG TPA_asm: hypothetical protein [Caudoviricetes sp.]
MRPDITNAIAALLLLRISVKRPVSALFIQAEHLLPAFGARRSASAIATCGVQSAPARTRKAPCSFSVNFQPA